MGKVTKHEVLEWLKDGIFSIVDGQVYTRAGRQLVQRINKRRGCQHGAFLTTAADRSSTFTHYFRKSEL